VRSNRIACLIVFALLARPLFACIWDYDTLRDERRGLPGMAELLAGRFEKRSEFFYRDRIERMQKLLDREPDNQDAMDNLAVALFRVRRIDEAIATLQHKENRFPNQYTTASNLATFYMLCGNSEDAIPLLKTALAINPNAHFGREKYQLKLAEFLVAAKNEPEYPLKDFLGNEPFWQFEKEIESNRPFVNSRFNAPPQSSDEQQAAMNAIAGMIRFGTDQSPDLFFALGNLLLLRGDRHLAYRAYERAVDLKHPRAKEIRDVLQRDVLGTISEDQPHITRDLIESERAGGEQWAKDYMDFADNLIRAGKDPDLEANYAEFYRKMGPSTQPMDFQLSDYVRPRWRENLAWTAAAAGAIFLVLAYSRYRRRKLAQRAACTIAAIALLLTPTLRAAEPTTREDDALVDKLAEISQPGIGYSTLVSGSEFVLYPDSTNIPTGVIGAREPYRSSILEAVVRRGADIVPTLIKHLDDARPTKIPPVHGISATMYGEYYDNNDRVHPRTWTPPKRKEGDEIEFADPHQLTVGDLCFVALGQIVNREFHASRYVPSGNLVICSPTHSRDMCKAIQADFANFTREKHLQMLVDDFENPDDAQRLINAYYRLSFYYPDAAEKLALKRLKVPAFDRGKLGEVIDKLLDPATSADARQKIFDEYVATHGPAASDGILSDLWELYISDGEADQPPHKAILVQLFHLKPDLTPNDSPYIDTWSQHDRASFVRALIHDSSLKVKQAIAELARHADGDEELAKACEATLKARETPATAPTGAKQTSQ
jgi:tetratricopeptide (TPR) repeat protein